MQRYQIVLQNWKQTLYGSEMNNSGINMKTRVIGEMANHIKQAIGGRKLA